MSEYQYYEFLAIDRLLTARDQNALRRCSTRAQITANRFVNHYDYGDFRGNADAWMAKYFDVFVYVASWGTRMLMLRLPRTAIDIRTARQYSSPRSVPRLAGTSVVLTFTSEDESGDRWDDDGRGWMALLAPLRGDLSAGDHRALYLAWLGGVIEYDLDADHPEPPVPPGLGKLTPTLAALVDFLGIDDGLVAAAARKSPRLPTTPKRGLERWIASLSEADKKRLLLRAATGDAIGAELVAGYRRTLPVVMPSRSGRTVADLLLALD